MKKKQIIYSEEFKKQIVALYNNGKRSAEILAEYKMSASILHKWIKIFNATSPLPQRIIEVSKKMN